MLALNRRTIHTAILSLALGGAIAGCSSEGTGPEINPAVVGTWNATSFMFEGSDVIVQGTTVSFGFTNDGTYSFNFANDQGVLCDVGTACVDTGDYEATVSQIVLDPDTVDEQLFNYSIAGTTMTITGDVDGAPVTIVLNKA